MYSKLSRPNVEGSMLDWLSKAVIVKNRRSVPYVAQKYSATCMGVGSGTCASCSLLFRAIALCRELSSLRIRQE